VSKSDNGLGRAVPEWIGATPDAPLPKRVKDRIWLREGGRCYLSGRKIQVGDTYEFEHVIAITLGGENRESNIRLALKAPHAEKTKADVKTNAKVRRIRMKHAVTWPKSKTRIRSRGFSPSRKEQNNG
jgi:5-methylcytosine-specific restriction endonuclease McrA